MLDPTPKPYRAVTFVIRRKGLRPFRQMTNSPRGSIFSPPGGRLKYRLANKRGVAGPLDTWPGNCDTVTPAPVIVSPPGIDADGYAAGLRRYYFRCLYAPATSPPDWRDAQIAAQR